MARQVPPGVALWALGGMEWLLWGVSVRIFASLTGQWAMGRYAHKRGHQGWRVEGLPVQGYNLPGLGLVTFARTGTATTTPFRTRPGWGWRRGRSTPASGSSGRWSGWGWHGMCGCPTARPRGRGWCGWTGARPLMTGPRPVRSPGGGRESRMPWPGAEPAGPGLQGRPAFRPRGGIRGGQRGGIKQRPQVRLRQFPRHLADAGDGRVGLDVRDHVLQPLLREGRAEQRPDDAMIRARSLASGRKPKLMTWLTTSTSASARGSRLRSRTGSVARGRGIAAMALDRRARSSLRWRSCWISSRRPANPATPPMK